MPRSVATARAAALLDAAGIEAPGREARLLLRWATGRDAAMLMREGDAILTAAEAERLASGLTARAARHPLAQITGERLFWGRPFRVTADVLDPRPETEAVISAALAIRAPAPGRIADLGTGTGCLLLTLLAEWPWAEGVGTDRSAAALVVAAKNAARLGLEARARLISTSWLDGITARFDLIVSNPPYIAASALSGLAPEVREHEPRGALVPDPDPLGDGLGAYRAIAAAAPSRLESGGRLLLEIGHTQGPAVVSILAEHGFGVIEVLPDLDGRERVVSAQKPLRSTKNE
ncbi:MAG: peptide chain release factor N(5)-glutamine methyltransferase [Pseudomonadota bacterium]